MSVVILYELPDPLSEDLAAGSKLFVQAPESMSQLFNWHVANIQTAELLLKKVKGSIVRDFVLVAPSSSYYVY